MANHTTSTPDERDYLAWRCPYGDHAAKTWDYLNAHSKVVHGHPWRTHLELLSNRDANPPRRPAYRYTWQTYLHVNCRAWGDLRSNCVDCGPFGNPDDDDDLLTGRQWTDRMAHLLENMLEGDTPYEREVALREHTRAEVEGVAA